MPIFNPLFGKGRDEYARLLKQGLEWIFDYDIYQDTPGEQTLVCVFKNLKPKDAMALPSYLLVKYDQPFEITYKVKSEQSGGSSGRLKILA